MRGYSSDSNAGPEVITAGPGTRNRTEYTLGIFTSCACLPCVTKYVPARSHVLTPESFTSRIHTFSLTCTTPYISIGQRFSVTFFVFKLESI